MLGGCVLEAVAEAVPDIVLIPPLTMPLFIPDTGPGPPPPAVIEEPVSVE